MAEVAGRLEGVRRVSSRPRRSSRLRSATNCGGGRRLGADLADRDRGGRTVAAGVRRGLQTVRFRAAGDALAAEGVAVSQQRMDCLIAATDLLAAEAIKPNTLAVLASRHWGGGAVPGESASGRPRCAGARSARAAAATADVGANLLVIDPAAGTLFQWKQMLIEFCRGGVRPCPAAMKNGWMTASWRANACELPT